MSQNPPARATLRADEHHRRDWVDGSAEGSSQGLGGDRDTCLLKALYLRLKGKRGRGTLVAEKPPIFGMLQRGGQVVIRMLENVKQATIKPLLKQTIQPGSLIYSDEYTIYSRLPE